MQFDPKLIREDDANFEGDLKLPDDLALMAQQLGDDAARLAATYPPPKPAVLVASRRKTAAPSRRSFWLMRSLAGTALAVGLVTISLVASNSYNGVTGERPASAGRSLGAGENGGKVVQLHRPAYAGRSPLAHESPSPSSQVPVTPASWLGDTSGPELEALMDLWEKDQPAVRSLSF
ncbi:MAG: hypothetical protein K8R36_09105 [Planctomycetales bacterium]|nr:hypothetical protein [Planctomycetales bacterium]